MYFMYFKYMYVYALFYTTAFASIINVKLENNHIGQVLQRIKDVVKGGIQKVKHKLRLNKRLVTSQVFGNTNSNLFSVRCIHIVFKFVVSWNDLSW